MTKLTIKFNITPKQYTFTFEFEKYDQELVKNMLTRLAIELNTNVCNLRFLRENTTHKLRPDTIKNMIKFTLIRYKYAPKYILPDIVTFDVEAKHLDTCIYETIPGLYRCDDGRVFGGVLGTSCKCQRVMNLKLSHSQCDEFLPDSVKNKKINCISLTTGVIPKNYIATNY